MAFVFFLLLTASSLCGQPNVHALPEHTYIPHATGRYEWQRVLHIRKRILVQNSVTCADSTLLSFGGYGGDNEAGGCGPVVKSLNRLDGKHFRTDTLRYPGKGFMNNVFFVRDSLLFIGGGRDSCLSLFSWPDFWRYDLSTQQWKQLADLPFYYRHKPYMFNKAGRTLVLVPRLEGQEFERNSLWLYEYDDAADKWRIISQSLPPSTEILPPGCTGIQHLWPVAFMLEEYIYVLFQYLNTREAKPGCTSSFYRCDIGTGEWTRLPSFPGYLECFAFGISDGVYGYIGGGYAFSRAKRKEVYRYDPVLAKWERITNLPKGVAHANAWNLGGETYVGFGINEQDNTVSVWKLKYKGKKRR